LSPATVAVQECGDDRDLIAVVQGVRQFNASHFVTLCVFGGNTQKLYKSIMDF
jgi:hypothetical protein